MAANMLTPKVYQIEPAILVIVHWCLTRSKNESLVSKTQFL